MYYPSRVPRAPAGYRPRRRRRPLPFIMYRPASCYQSMVSVVPQALRLKGLGLELGARCNSRRNVGRLGKDRRRLLCGKLREFLVC